MKIRYLVLALIGAMALSFGAVACSSDDDDDNGGAELTLAEYFNVVAPLSQGYAADLASLDEEAEAEMADAESEDDRIELFVSFVGDLGSTTDAFVDSLDDVDAPAEAEDAHNEAVSAGRALADMYDNAVIVLDTADTFENATLVMQGPGLVDAQDRFAASCVALQGIADDNGIDADMACPAND